MQIDKMLRCKPKVRFVIIRSDLKSNMKILHLELKTGNLSNPEIALLHGDQELNEIKRKCGRELHI